MNHHAHNTAGTALFLPDENIAELGWAELTQRFERFCEASLAVNSDALLVVDGNGRLVALNGSAERLLGRSQQQLLGQPLADVVHLYEERSRAALTAALTTSCLDRRSRYDRDALLVSGEGLETPVHCSAVPLNGPERTATGALVAIKNLSDARRIRAQLTQQLRYDTLTGLFNRTTFQQRLQRSLSAASGSSGFALCHIDIDRFKVINDSYGHTAGDELLRQLAARLRRQLRRGDLLGRLGGDVFGVLFCDCDPLQAEQLAQRLRKEIKRFSTVWQRHTLRVSASVGLAHSAAADTTEHGVSRLFCRAENACRGAKRGGGNRLRPDIADADIEGNELRLLRLLQRALHDNTLRLCAQPLGRPGRTGAAFAHYELLVRLPDDGAPLPDVFIPVAERSHLVQEVDRWVIRTALERLRAYPVFAASLTTLSINVSGQSLGDRRFQRYVERRLDDCPQARGRLCLELAETGAAADVGALRDGMLYLAERGLRFALDDIGRGLSSFAYLRDLPVDAVKIDGRFVQHIDRDPADLAVLASINDVAHALGKKTVAEYAVNNAVVARLRELGVDYAQGDAIGPVQPFDALLDGYAPDAGVLPG